MENLKLDEVLEQIQKGSELAREQLITHYKSYIQNVASRICQRYISWNDEEASIALIAFNRAIDTFDKDGGRTFLNYGYLLINRDLIDHFRKETKENHLSLNDEERKKIEHVQSVENYEQMVAISNLVDEIIEFDQLLNEFQISFEELEKYSPKHEDTRKMIIQMVNEFLQDDDCMEALMEKKTLPITLFSKKTGYKKKTLERHRKYFITMILIKCNRRWVHLRQYIGESSRNEGQ